MLETAAVSVHESADTEHRCYVGHNEMAAVFFHPSQSESAFSSHTKFTAVAGLAQAQWSGSAAARSSSIAFFYRATAEGAPNRHVGQSSPLRRNNGKDYGIAGSVRVAHCDGIVTSWDISHWTSRHVGRTRSHAELQMRAIARPNRRTGVERSRRAAELDNIVLSGEIRADDGDVGAERARARRKRSNSGRAGGLRDGKFAI